MGKIVDAWLVVLIATTAIFLGIAVRLLIVRGWQ